MASYSILQWILTEMTTRIVKFDASMHELETLKIGHPIDLNRQIASYNQNSFLTDGTRMHNFRTFSTLHFHYGAHPSSIENLNKIIPHEKNTTNCPICSADKLPTQRAHASKQKKQ